ncbi:dihydrofolate reductase family protein [Agromyces sp. NPDC004153]
MGKVIVIEFITLDGVVEDPDGRGGAGFGGWAFRFGLEAIAGDLFGIVPALHPGVLLFGRRTWEHLSRLWPERTDPFSTAMNRARKVVVSAGSPDLDPWDGSERLDGDLVEGVARLATEGDVVVIGSLSVVRELQAAGLVDEYRLFTFPTVVGDPAAMRLFASPVELELVSIESRGPATFSVLAA